MYTHNKHIFSLFMIIANCTQCTVHGAHVCITILGVKVEIECNSCNDLTLVNLKKGKSCCRDSKMNIPSVLEAQNECPKKK